LQFVHILEDIKTTVSPFLFLALDLPPPPLFQDAIEKNIIPQVNIHTVLAKYDGKTTQVSSFHNSQACCLMLLIGIWGATEAI